MERIKEKPPIQSKSREKAVMSLPRNVPSSLQRSIGKYKETLQDAAEQGQSPEDYGGQAISDYALSAPVQAVRTGHALATQYTRKAREKNDAEPPEEYLRDLHSQREASKQPQIKEKEPYIQAQPTQMEQHPNTESMKHYAMEQGRELAENRAQTQKELRREASISSAEGNIEPSPSAHPDAFNRERRYSAPSHSSEKPTVRSGRTEHGRSPASQSNRSEQGIKKYSFREKRSSASFRSRKHPPTDRGSAAIRPPRSLVRDTIPKRHTSPASMSPPLASPSVMQKRMQTVLLRQEQTFRSAGSAVKRTVKAVQAGAKSVKSMVSVFAVGGAGLAAVIVLLVVLFGGLLNMTGGDNAVAAVPVSAEVQAYEPTIRLYATQYGIPEYVELIKAVMMQESGGRGLDPMQAAEGGYNTRYPHVPNGITDPDYSIQCGVQELRDSLNRAGVESPLDMEHIKLALQGYNYGPGYITWAVSNYGGYSLVNAAEFSDMQAAKLGWRRYGDKEYVPHVLRYYAFGRLPGFGGSGAPMIQIALSQEGNDGRIYWGSFGHTSRVAWCSEFVSWCADQAGLIDAGLVPRSAVCTDSIAWFNNRGRFVDSSYIPSPGDLIFFDWGNDGHADHVGIVVSVANGRVYTIEGNSSDRVRRNDYSLNSSSIYGYGVVG